MEDLVGKTLKRYRIETLLSEGGMGAVFKARDVTLQRDVAIKVVHPQFTRRDDFRERFLQQARAAAGLDHPGIVRVHDFGQAEGYLYIVMEFIPGDNLRKMLQDLKASGQWIVLPEATQLVGQICLAIDYAHQQGVLHQGVKPDNVMLKPEVGEGLPYRPVLTDLGLAKLVKGGLISQQGVSMGTPAYMSPEQAQGEETDARSDVYSLGVLLFELATSQLPFHVRTIAEAILCHTQESPPLPRSLRPDLPEALERVILQALEKDPDERFPDAKTLAAALQSLDQTTLIATAPPTALAGQVSLLTQYHKSLPEPRGPSIFAEFRSASPDVTQDRVQILSLDRASRSVSIQAEGLTIGREADNDLVLGSTNVSRHHAKVEFDGQDYRVTDLDSTSGTFLGNVKLLPGVAEVWTTDQALRIGNIWLRLQRARRQPNLDTVVFRSDGTMVDQRMLHSSRGGGRVGLFAEVQQLSVAPGRSVSVPVVVLNQGALVDRFSTSVRGVPANWLVVEPTPVDLMPGQQQEVSITIQPPYTPASRERRYPLSIRVSSQDAPQEVAEVKWALTVTAYSGLRSKDFMEEKIRMDVHTPETVKVNIPFEIGAAIRQPESPASEEVDLPVLTSKPGRVFRKRERRLFRQREQEVVKYRVRISAPAQDLEVHTKERFFLLRSGTDSEVHYFQLTAKRAGHISLLVEAYQEDELLAADTRVHLIATLRAVGLTDAHGRRGPRAAVLSYRNLDLEAIDHRGDVDEERFCVRVIDSPAGQQTASEAEEVCLKASLRRRLQRLETRRTDLTMMMDLGEALAGLLFPPRARRLLRNSLSLLRGNESLRIRLRLDTYALADLPWEYIYIPATDTPREHRGPEGFLALDRRVSLVRYEVIGQPLVSLDPVGGPSLRLVALLANPWDDLDLEIEQVCIEEALKETPGVRPSFYPGATVSTLLDSLVKGAHIFHFAGHGSFEGRMGDRFGTKEGTGCIVLEGKDPEYRKFEAGKLAQNLRGRGVRLAVFTACEVGRADPRNAWSGVAPALTRAGIPAVLAMQYRIYDGNAIAFSRQFYRTLASGETIDGAVFEGRLAIFNRSGNHERDWGVPVLYLRAEEGVLFPS